MSTYQVFAQYTDSTYAYTVTYAATPVGRTYYDVRLLNGTTAYEFSFDSSSNPWLDSINLGWTPNTIQAAGESKNSGDHFPGSTLYTVSLDSIYYVNHGSVVGANMGFSSTPSGNSITGLTNYSGMDFIVWDRRCSDAG